MVAAVYAGLTIIASQFLQYLSWGLVQLRISEAFTVVACFTPAAIPGLTIGSIIANLANLPQTGPAGWLDVVFGSLGTLVGAVWTWRFRKRTALALLGPVLSNALIVPAYLPFILAGLGLYQVPILGLDLERGWLVMYLFGVVAIGVGQAIVVYGLGWPLLRALSGLRDRGDLAG